MSKQDGFWGKLRRKLGKGEAGQSLPNIEIPKIEMSRSPSSEVDVSQGLDSVFLRQQMSNHLDDSELQQIGDTFGVDFRALQGGKGRRVLDLVNQIQEQNQLEDLLQHCQQIKPDVSWQLRP